MTQEQDSRDFKTRFKVGKKISLCPRTVIEKYKEYISRESSSRDIYVNLNSDD
jgi:hypothetical protein